ncbi:hypothetical protein BK130_16515 [Viridibacillus sp. FSL H8-0123]|nr:hypothetical protein BK130_16515 [Viridibacillus sp. FSL H8-0123]
MFLFLLFTIPSLLGVLWFFNLITFLEKLHQGKNTHNQKVLGGLWTFAFISVFIYCIISLF